MNRRERILLIVTVLIVAPLLIYHFFLADWLEGMAGQAGGDLSVERARFASNIATLADRRQIETAYSRIDFSQSQPLPGQNATEHFLNELYGLLTEEFQIMNPRIEKARPQAIPDVPEYYFVELEVTVEGSPEEMLRLLVNMENRGVLIKSLTIDTRSGGGFGRDDELVNLTVEVARLVKHTEESMKMMRGFGSF
ncbi:MAG TPA: hypothetical protein PLS90_01025 [Candidatus Sumerlaeota bacterium]|nr:MAG: hypothetical protein BWZ08_00458 [candidate division BRC1 bacterium ADurb.BinA292]HOE97416.1 hypothetical protein [Candidatus Sumerlaeota bacterium]HOR27734.1 hypothetical protein [Candidatus Sumerlaeota bacterium]HPK01013.1 hypothetical protein [Candidatus Sumerlaeota bacterium]